MVKKDKNWSYDSKENEWYHWHTKRIWPFRKEYYVHAGPVGWCPKCGKWVPQELMNPVRSSPDVPINRPECFRGASAGDIGTPSRQRRE